MLLYIGTDERIQSALLWVLCNDGIQIVRCSVASQLQKMIRFNCVGIGRLVQRLC